MESKYLPSTWCSVHNLSMGAVIIIRLRHNGRATSIRHYGIRNYEFVKMSFVIVSFVIKSSVTNTKPGANVINIRKPVFRKS